MSIKKREQDTELVRISQYLAEGEHVELTESERHRLDRLIDCHGLIKKYGSRLKVVQQLIKLHNGTISESTGYRDFNDCQQLWGTTHVGELKLHVDILLGFIMERLTIARANDDLKQETKLLALYKDTINDFFKDGLVNYQDIQPPPVIIGVFRDMINVDLPSDWRTIVERRLEKKMNSKGIIDVEFEEDYGSGE